MTNEFQEGDLLLLGIGASGVSWGATIDLGSGDVEADWSTPPKSGRRTWDKEEVEFSLSEEELEHVRKNALDLEERGDHESRDQFAQAGANITLQRGNEQVAAGIYHVEGGVPYYDALFLLIRRKIRAIVYDD